MKVFVTGATGFIGGSVAVRLRRLGHEVRGLTRTREKAVELSSIGIDPVIGDLDASDILMTEARTADAVINAADSDHRTSIMAFVDALRGSGKPLLHTSGSSIVGDDARGEPSEDIFDDSTAIHPTPDKAARVAIDQLVRDAASLGVRSAVLCNSLIYGWGEGLHRESIQIPDLVRQARKSGVARYVGRGLNVWSTVHISDVVDLYLLALDKAAAGSFMFVENGEASFGDLADAISRALNLGGPMPWTIDEAIAEWGYERAVYALGSNSRVRSLRARQLGWNPTHSSALSWIQTELIGGGS